VTTCLEASGIFDTQDQQFIDFDSDSRHAMLRCIDGCHAINPSIHVSTVEVWKAHYNLEYLME